MSNRKEKTLLIGDNPFHSISHLSQERSIARGNSLSSSEYAASLVMTSLKNGAEGFMFSVSETTLSILRVIREKEKNKPFDLYAIVPYAYEYFRLANELGGISGLTWKIAKEIVTSWNLRAVGMGLKGIIREDPTSLMRAYLTYEISRIKSSAGKQANLTSVLLHQAITDMVLALKLDWLFKSYIDFMLRLGIVPGFNTGNLAYLVDQFREWDIDLHNILIAAPFNKVAFQMNPSRGEYEKALADMPAPIVIAISILAAGYLKPLEAISYIATLPNIKGVAVGVSKESHASETFKLLQEKLNG